MTDWAGIIIAIGIIVLIIGISLLIGYGANMLDRTACKQNAEIMNVDYDYGFIKGCLWKINGEWINSKNYRMID